METVEDFIFLGSKITVDSDCSHEIKRRLLLGRNAMTNLNSIFKSIDITLPTKVCKDYDCSRYVIASFQGASVFEFHGCSYCPQ